MEKYKKAKSCKSLIENTIIIIGEVIMLAPIFYVAYLFDILPHAFVITFCTIIFKKIYKYEHHLNNWQCLIVTYIVVPISLLIAYAFRSVVMVSIIISNIIAFSSSTLAYLIMRSKLLDRTKNEMKELEKANTELDMRLNTLLANLSKQKETNIFDMDENELRTYARSMGLKNEYIIDTLVLRIIGDISKSPPTPLRWCEIQKLKNFTKDGLRYHKEQILERLGINKKIF